MNTIHGFDVQLVTQKAMPYDCLDDHRIIGDTLVVKIVDQENDLYNRLLLIHALVEHTVAQMTGVTDSQIDGFDMNYQGDGEPGDDVDAPYRDAHCLGVAVERMICAHLHVPYTQYEKDIMVP